MAAAPVSAAAAAPVALFQSAAIGAETAEVPLAIIRILEAARQRAPVSNAEAHAILSSTTLDEFLSGYAEAQE